MSESDLSRALLQPSRHSYLAFLVERYASVKQFSGQLLAHQKGKTGIQPIQKGQRLHA